MIRLLLHPLAIPIYTYAFYVELERQSYSLNIRLTLFTAAFMIILALWERWFSNYFSTKYGKEKNALANPKAEILPRLVTALIMTSIYSYLTYLIITSDHTYTWGQKFILTIYILPLWANILSGQGFQSVFPSLGNTAMAKICLAPSAFIGSLSGFIITIGYKTSVDTFWSFSISLALVTLLAYNHLRKGGDGISGILCGYFFGIIQSVIIMFIFS